MKRSKMFFCEFSNVFKNYELVMMDLGVPRNITRSRASDLDIADFQMITPCTSSLRKSKFSLCFQTTVDFIL